MNFFNKLTIINDWLSQKPVKVLLVAVTLFFLFTHFIYPITLITADVGRHIRNGQVLLDGHTDVLTKNFYSLTYAEHPFVNHHWGVGVLFHGLYEWFGFDGLSWFYLGLLLLTSFIFFNIFYRRSNLIFALLFTALAAPIIADRVEIRPEGFSALFFGLYLWVLWGVKDKALSQRWLYLLPAIQIVWVNTHIFFVGGWLLLLFFIIDAVFNDQEKKEELYIVGALSVIASVLNPSGWVGALQPLNIFKGFGYMLVENQSVFFMYDRFGDMVYIHFLILCAVVLIAVITWCYTQKQWRQNIALLFVLLAMMIAGINVSRCMAIASLFIVTIGGVFTYRLWDRYGIRHITSLVCMMGLVVFLLLSFTGVASYWTGHERIARIFPRIFQHDKSLLNVLRRPNLWIGVLPVMQHSALFFKQHNIEGPVFNNYDIGGYLIYHLFPQERLFMDNRQEAFPPDFFQDVYIPMQENEAVWQQQDQQHQFNAIYFYRHDLTPWGQPFLLQRVRDPQWAPVYVDGFTIIFLKRNAKNARIIEQFELPASMFNAVRN